MRNCVICYKQFDENERPEDANWTCSDGCTSILAATKEAREMHEEELGRIELTTLSVSEAELARGALHGGQPVKRFTDEQVTSIGSTMPELLDSSVLLIQCTRLVSGSSDALVSLRLARARIDRVIEMMEAAEALAAQQATYLDMERAEKEAEGGADEDA